MYKLCYNSLCNLCNVSSFYYFNVLKYVYITIYVKSFQLNRILSCSLKELEVKSNWTSISVYNQFSYEIFDTIPNSQYSVQVIIAYKDINTIHQKNMIYVLTPALSKNW